MIENELAKVLERIHEAVLRQEADHHRLRDVTVMGLFNSQCEYCSGTVRERTLEREPISLRRGIVVLEQVPLGVCDRCGAYYYPAPVLKRAEAILASATPPRRTLEVPIETY